MRARDLMCTEVLSVSEDSSVPDLIEVLVREHIHGVPVLNAAGELVGIVTQQDVFFGAMSLGGTSPARKRRPGGPSPPVLTARDIMTSPAVTAGESTSVRRLCALMHRLRIHRIPIVRRGRLVGIVSTLDVCGAVAAGQHLD